MSKRVGWICALLATIAYSTNTTIARGAILGGMHPITLLAGRFLLASGLYAVTVSAFSLVPAMGAEDTKNDRPLDRFGLCVSIGSGLINGLVLVCFFMALRTVSASISSMTSITLIQFFTIGILAFRGETITMRKVIRLAIGLIGLYFLIGLDGSADPFGLLLLVVGSIFFAVHIVSVQWFLKTYNTWTITALIVGSATASTLALWLINGAETFVPAPYGWLAIVFQAVVTTFVGRILTYKAINIIGSAQYALLAPLETSLTVIWATLFLDERLTLTQWIGTAFVLLGIILAIDLVWSYVTKQLANIKVPPFV